MGDIISYERVGLERIRCFSHIRNTHLFKEWLHPTIKVYYRFLAELPEPLSKSMFSSPRFEVNLNH